MNAGWAIRQNAARENTAVKINARFVGFMILDLGCMERQCGLNCLRCFV
jgi:hypothetical protein